ncbi:hypothetical protein ACYZX9_12945 [Sphingomonas citri]
MGYDLHITRREFWFDEGEDIDFSEWTTFVARAPDMQFDECAETSIENDKTSRTQSSDLAIWTKYSKHGENGCRAWFHFYNGTIVVKNPDVEIRKKMFEVARHLNARVQGDDAEFYDEYGNILER